MEKRNVGLIIGMAATLMLHGVMKRSATTRPSVEQAIPEETYVPEVTGKAAASLCEARRRLWCAAIAVLVCYGWVIAWWVCGDANSFSRSGSIVTVYTLLTESLLSEGVGRLNRALRASHGDYYTVWRVICAITAVVGTLIWGYGDLLYLKMMPAG